MHKKHPHLIHSQYRPDIDGMRAIAILSVLGFHAFPEHVSAGFVGVDIFFVISGFLISSIIFSSLERGRFRLTEFYIRRIRRIFPALIVVMVTCLVIGWFVLLGDEYQQLGKHTFGGTGFFLNFILWRESGYFDSAAVTKPLLHLWSLAIEEQFYIFWPLMLAFVWRRQWSFLRITVVIAAVSFAINIYLVHGHQTAAFYLPVSRFWELMVGGVLAYISLHRPELNSKYSDAQSILGMVLLVLGLVFIDESTLFPGSMALLPTLGAAFLISSGQNTWISRNILSNKVLVWVGLISYPLYLWHWPLLSFAGIVEGETPALYFRVAAMMTAVILAWLTYMLIEKPFRFGGYITAKTFCLLGMVLFIALAGFTINKVNGVKKRAAVEMNPLINSGFDGGDGGVMAKGCGIDNEQDRNLFAHCIHDTRQTPKYALLGDSKAAAISQGLVRTSSDKGRWLFIGGNGPYGAPVPVISGAPIYKAHQALISLAVHAIANNAQIEKVVLVAATRALFKLKRDDSIEDLPASRNYDAAFHGLNNTIELLIRHGKRIVIVADNPTFPDPKNCVSRVTGLQFINQYMDTALNPMCSISIIRYMELSRQYRNLLANIAKAHRDKVKIFGTMQYLCDSKLGLCLPFRDGRLLYSYSDHISDYAAGLIGKDLNQFLASY